MIQWITETAQYYKKTEIISFEFRKIWDNCLSNYHNLMKIKKQYKNNKKLIQVIEDKLDENEKVKNAASDEWLYKRVRLREILHKLCDKINYMHQQKPSINDKLIQEMNTAIDTMREKWK